MSDQRKIVVLCVAAVAAFAEAGEFRFNTMYSSHMVLQRGEPVRVCGFAEAGRTVEVTFRGASASAQTADDGRWAVALPAGDAGGPFVLTAKAGESALALEDVMVGEVWFCTGQSNMWWPLCDSGDPEKEIAAADHPNIRLLDVALTGAETETDEPPYVCGWSRCTPQLARHFSACAYHFARTLREKLGDVPVGLIGAGWPGPPISHFLPPRAGLNQKYLEQSRAALAAAAKGFAEEDRLREVCRAFFADEQAMAARVAGPMDDARGGTVELPVKKGIAHTVLDKFAGAAHFRRTLTLDSGWEKRASVLTLGAGCLPGVVCVNGRKVAAFKDWMAPVPGAEGSKAWRMTLDAGLLKAGENRIDVLVGCNDRLSWWGALDGPAFALTDAADAARTVSLNGAWSYDRFIDIPKPPRTFGGSWCARIHPFFQMPVKGVIFYQGESDSRRPAAAYLADQMRLVKLLREGWQKDELPFYCMQLASHARKRNADNGFCEIREAQRLTAELVPGTGCAVSIDIGEDVNIHPKNKREQGRRLALQALAKTYGCKDVIADGPTFERLVRSGRTAEVVFKSSSSPLVVKGAALTGFEARPAGGAWQAVTAEVAGDRVKLVAPFEIADVRYLWQNFPEPGAALFNAAGLPATPFRYELKAGR